MLLFSCPHCDELLKVPEAHLGKRGRCNKCGGRIALIGRAGLTGVQAASMVADELLPGGEGDPGPKPVTEKQVEYLKALGAPEQQVRNLDRNRASDLIDRLRMQRQSLEPATDKQLAYLRRLAATDRQLQRIKSKADAGQLIEDMHLLPTAEQMERLHQLGATGAQMAALKTKAAAEAMIEELSN